jgi:hypothetical protein
MRTTIITTAQPFRFAGVVAASGIALSPFAPTLPVAATSSAPVLRIVRAAS